MTLDKDELANFAAELREAYVSHDSHLPFDEQQSFSDFDLHGFDWRLAIALGVETPADYAQRKAEEDLLAVPVSPLDDYSMGRKLVKMLGPEWTWQMNDNGIEATAMVLCEDNSFFATHRNGPIALRIAALSAMDEIAP